MPKFYVECGPTEGLVCEAQERLESCVYLIHGVLADESEEDFALAPFIVVSEAGFNEDILKWAERGQEKMLNEQYIFSTATILRFMELDDIADGLDQWCIDQHNPILNKTLQEVKDSEDLSDGSK